MPRWGELKANFRAALTRAKLHRQREHANQPPSRTRSWSGLIWGAGIFVGFVAVVLVVLASIDWNVMRGPMSRYLSARLHRDVQIEGDLDVKPFSWTPRMTIDGLKVSQPSWVTDAAKQAKDVADIRQLTLAVDLMNLLRFRLILPEVTLDQPQLSLLRDEMGRENWQSDPTDKRPLKLPVIRHFVIRDGHVDFTDVKRRLVFGGTIASEEGSEAAGKGSFRLIGDGQLNRRPFSMRMNGDPLLDLAPDTPYGFSTDIRAGATRIEARGSLHRPFDFGAFDVVATFAGPDMADLYYLTGLALPNTPPYRVSGDLARDRDIWRLHNLAGKAGDSDVKGELTVDAAPERPLLTGDLVSQTLNFIDLGALIGAKPMTGSGTTATGATAKPPTDDRALPDARLDAERLRQMDANAHYRAAAVVSRDFPLRTADVKLTLKNGVLNLEPVSFFFSRGKLDGTVRIDARNATPVSDIDLRLTELRLEQFVSRDGSQPPLEGTAAARAQLHGTGDSIRRAAANANGKVAVVVPHGQIRKALAELLGINVSNALGLLLTNDQSQTDVRCAVAEFTVKNGVMQLDQFVFDTGVVMATGSGVVDLRNERVDLSITGHPKKPQLVRVRAPITIGGALSHPAVGVKAGQALAQGGLAAGLAFVLSPLAAILPFIDPGLAKDADCGALLAQAQSSG